MESFINPPRVAQVLLQSGVNENESSRDRGINNSFWNHDGERRESNSEIEYEDMESLFFIVKTKFSSSKVNTEKEPSRDCKARSRGHQTLNAVPRFIFLLGILASLPLLQQSLLRSFLPVLTETGAGDNRRLFSLLKSIIDTMLHVKGISLHPMAKPNQS